ncbi:MAG: ion channel [Nitrososphaeraceae archaeon]
MVSGRLNTLPIFLSSDMKKYEILAVILAIVDLTSLTITASSSPTGIENIVTYLFDIVVIGLIAYTFGRRVKESVNRRRYIISNWYAILGMIPVMVFVFVGQGSSYYDGFVAVGIMLRLLGLVYLIKQFHFIGNKASILGGHKTMQIFIIFYLVITISSFFFYISEHSNTDSQITTMGDALWWTVQTVTTSTFGPNAVTTDGRIVGTIIMLVGIAITGTFISSLAIGLTKSRSKNNTEIREDPVTILKIRMAKGEITREVYMDLIKLMSQ